MVTPDGLIWDHLNGTSCILSNYTFTCEFLIPFLSDPAQIQPDLGGPIQADSVFVDNSGLYIAAYAELGHLTKNATATSLAQRVAIASMNTPIWNTASGINKEGAGDEAASDDSIGFKSIMIRYLHKAYPWFTDEAVKAAVVQYINIQYWALTQLGSDSSTHPIRYGRNWTGPAFNLSSEHAQL